MGANLDLKDLRLFDHCITISMEMRRGLFLLRYKYPARRDCLR